MILIFMGILLIMAASPAVADQHKWSSFHFIKKHIIFLIPTLMILGGVSFLSVDALKRLAIGLFGVSLCGLALTYFMGVEIKGACRWLVIGGVSVQVSEFMKPAFAVVSAMLFAKQQEDSSFPGNLLSMGLCGIVLAFLLLQPDLGMSVLILSIWFAQFFLAGLPLMWILSGAACGCASLVGAYFLFSHVKRRIDHFLFPDGSDKFGDRYQITQSLDAFMNGGFIGKGPGEGTVKKYLPDAHADFIFAVAGEEFGLILCVCLVGVFTFIILRTLSRLFEEKNLFIILAVTGLMVQFGLQTIINMASTLNLMPTKGMTLPFVSYGGSSMLALALGMGMVLGLTRRRLEIHERS